MFILYIFAYILLIIGVAYYLRYRKVKKSAAINFDRKKVNDYMNDPRFSYMSCNKYNKNSKFFKDKKIKAVKKDDFLSSSSKDDFLSSSSKDNFLSSNKALTSISLGLSGVRIDALSIAYADSNKF